MTGRGGWAWRDGDVVLLVLTAVLGLVAIIGAWFGASGATTLARQAVWLEAAMGGFAVAGVGMCLWIMRGRRAIGERRAALVSLAPEQDDPSEPAPVRRTGDMTAPLHLVRAEGMRRVHSPDCPLVAGKAVWPADLGDGDPCTVCKP